MGSYSCNLLIVISAAVAMQALSVEGKFKDCSPKTCGAVQNIRDPFWVAQSDESNCGYPEFEIICDDTYPVLKISGSNYAIQRISDSSHSFLLTNPEVEHHPLCPIPLHNLSFDGKPFTFSSYNHLFYFFYNCTSKPQDFYYPIDCTGIEMHYSFATFDRESLQRKDYHFESCETWVTVPVHLDYGFNYSKLTEMRYDEILKMGFSLNWSEPKCSDCQSRGGGCGVESSDSVCNCGGTCKDVIIEKKKKRRKIIIGVGSGLGGVLLTCIILVIWQRRNKKKYAVSKSVSLNPSSMNEVEKGGIYLGINLFSYTELEAATNKFDSSKELGDGGFGTVYYGELRDGRAVAVMRLYENNCKRVEQFLNEVEILTRLHHKNLVTLYGCTSRHSRELLLVYEFIPNGTVADHLHGEQAKPGGLPWSLRMKIATETASALVYLHASDIIHRDVKTNNILLDNNYCVKVADFGLSRLFPIDVTHVSTAPQGTPGYLDPEYHECYQLTEKSDVYSFGVVLIELISSKPAVDITRHRHEINLSTMAINKIQNNALHELVDPYLGFESYNRVKEMIYAVAELAFQCLQGGKDARPSMSEVLKALLRLEGENFSNEKAENIKLSGEDAVLLKNGSASISPESETVNWTSTSTTPHTSS